MFVLENIDPWVFVLLTILIGWILSRFLPNIWAFGLPAFFLAGHFTLDEEILRQLIAYVFVLTVYLTGNAFPWRRLNIVRNKMYKLFFSVAAVYILLCGAALLVLWRLGLLAAAEPWLIYFTLAFGLVSYHEPTKLMLTLSVRGPLSLVLQHLGALSSFAVLLVLIFAKGFIPALLGLAAGLIFFALWLGFIRCSGSSPASILGRVLQFLFLFWLSGQSGFSLSAGALALGMANSLAGVKLLDYRHIIDIWKTLTALVFLTVLSVQKIKFTWLVFGIAAAVWILRFLLFYLYNFFARVYSFGEDFVRRVNFGLQVNDCRLILNVFVWCPAALPVAILVAAFEQLLYPYLLRRTLVLSGETEG